MHQENTPKLQQEDEIYLSQSSTVPMKHKKPIMLVASIDINMTLVYARQKEEYSE